jgi:hypothetical protein
VEQATKRNAEYLKAKQGDPATPPARHAHLLQLLDVLNTVTEAEGTGMGLPNTDDEPESTPPPRQQRRRAARRPVRWSSTG